MKFFSRNFQRWGKLNLYEEVHENCLFHYRDRDLRDRAGG